MENAAAQERVLSDGANESEAPEHVVATIGTSESSEAGPSDEGIDGPEELPTVRVSGSIRFGSPLLATWAEK